MRRTLKAIFDKRSDAQHVLDKLLASGYKHADEFGASVKHTFARMFGTKHDEAAAPPQEEAANAQHVVAFASESEPDAERAAGIIRTAGPTDIEEHHEHSDPETAGTYVPGIAAMRTVYPPGTQPGSLQFRAPEDSPYFGTQTAESRPSGNTFQDRMGNSPWPSPDRGASDAAAYRYGEEMRARDPSPDRSWEEAEPGLQSGWEHQHTPAGVPAWHRIKEAVRRGWERVKH